MVCRNLLKRQGNGNGRGAGRWPRNTYGALPTTGVLTGGIRGDAGRVTTTCWRHTTGQAPKPLRQVQRRHAGRPPTGNCGSHSRMQRTNQGRRTSTTAKWRCAGWPAGPDAIASRMHCSPYWAVSGYGLRASRALLTLLLVLAVATVLFATVGFGHTQQIVYVPVRSAIANQPVAYKQISVPDGKLGFREAAYYSVQSATSLLREPTTEPLTTIGRITEITFAPARSAASRPGRSRLARTSETMRTVAAPRPDGLVRLAGSARCRRHSSSGRRHHISTLRPPSSSSSRTRP